MKKKISLILLSTIWFLVVIFLFILTQHKSEDIYQSLFWGVIFNCIIFFNLKYDFWVVRLNTKPYSFHIIEFDVWDKNSKKYIKAYDFYEAYEYEKYFLFFKLGNYYDTVDLKKITEYLVSEAEYLNYYESKEVVMKQMMDRVNHLISKMKKENKEIILNVQEKDVYLFSELIQTKNGKK